MERKWINAPKKCVNTVKIIIYLLVHLGAQFLQFFLFDPKLKSQINS